MELIEAATKDAERRGEGGGLSFVLWATAAPAQSGKLVDALATGDKVDANDNAFGGSFPYLALPNVGAVNKGGGTGAGAAGTGGGQSEAARPTQTVSSTSNAGLTTFAIVAAAAAVTLGALLFGGWWRRRRDAAPATAASGAAVGTDDTRQL